MSESSPPAALDAGRLVATLERSRITHVMGIPDNTSAPLFDRLSAHDSIRLITVTREGEAFAIASGVWLGGGRPLVIVQNTGFLESGDALRGTAGRMGVPLPFVVTGRGYARMMRAGLDRTAELDPETVTRPDVDSVALLTEPTLDAWGIPYEKAETETDAALLDAVIERARTEDRPVALLLAQPVS